MKFEDQSEYKAVQTLIKELDSDGVITRFQGACLPACEIVQAILHSRNVKSRMLECTALVANSPTNGNSVHFIGFDSLVKLNENETDTHFVVLVESEQPFIIDPSIGHKLGNPRYVVVSPLTSTDPEIISEASFKGSTVTYRVKKNLRYFNLHQRTLMDRIGEEQKLRKDVSWAMFAVKVLIGAAVFNAIMNLSTLVLKLIHP